MGLLNYLSKQSVGSIVRDTKEELSKLEGSLCFALSNLDNGVYDNAICHLDDAETIHTVLQVQVDRLKKSIDVLRKEAQEGRLT